MKKIAIIGSRSLACNILEWIVQQELVEVVGVVAPKFKGWWNDKLADTAIGLGIEVFETLDELLEHKPDIVFSINYWKIIEESYIQKVPEGILNIHHSYLLKYRGRYSTSWAIMNARKLDCWQHGTTLHYISKELDAGPIVASYQCEILESDTAEALFARVEALAIQMFKDSFGKIINDQVGQLLEPDPAFLFYDIDSNKNLEIAYGQPIEDLYDIVRAWSFEGRPRPYFNFNGYKIFMNL